MLIQFHVLQNYAPSNLNRDDTGSPKDAIFGGVLRGRISSQCLKRSIRYSETFKVFDKKGLLGKRTKTLPSLLRNCLVDKKVDEETINAILSRLPEIVRGSTKVDKAENAEDENDTEIVETQEPGSEIKQLIFLDINTELDTFARKLVDAYINAGGTPKKWQALKKKELMNNLGESLPRSIDIAMFGRMTTSQAFKNVQAAVQVAHALSTNALKTEFDYYTAMDDLKPDSEPGADMIGDIEFNSCTYYKYFNIHWNGLVENLGGDKEIARSAVLTFLEAATMAHPTGKQNSFGAFNLPDFVLLEVTERNLPVSYANAFLTPVRGKSDASLLINSIEALDSYVERISKVYNLTPKRAHIAVQENKFQKAAPKPSLDDLKEWLGEQLPKI
jgi:CRISPR system Cascade subunit CasC